MTETNEYGHDLDRIVHRKANSNGKNVSVYHLRENCQYLNSDDVPQIDCKIRTLPDHRPCKRCQKGMNYAKGADNRGLRQIMHDIDGLQIDTILITRNSWEHSSGCYHTDSDCGQTTADTEFVEVDIERLPQIVQRPCMSCCDDVVIQIHNTIASLTDIDGRLTVDALADDASVWIASNTNHHNYVHLSDECPHMQEANNPDRKTARMLHDDRGLCRKCTDGWTNQSRKGKYNNIAARLKAADNPEDILHGD